MLLLLLSLLVPPADDDPRLAGTLHLGGMPADTGTVVLHRVTPEDAGAIDSVQVAADGRFELLLPEPPGSSGAIFFVTYRHDGVTFFGEPVTEVERLEEPYELRAWASRPRPAEGGGSFRVTFRNLVIEDGPAGWRVTDIFEVGHDDPYTWTSPDPDAREPVWRHPLPDGILNLRSGGAELTSDALRLDRGALEVVAPFPPGERLFVLHYDLPSIETTIPMTGVTDAIEVMVREPAPEIWIEGLRADLPVEMERGNVYRRWWAENVSDVAPRIRLGEEPRMPIAWAAIALALLLIGIGSWYVLRTDPPAARE